MERERFPPPQSLPALNSEQRRILQGEACNGFVKARRTVEDLDSASSIGDAHISEAIQYRSLDRSYWTLFA